MRRTREPVWLLPEVVLALHERVIVEFGGAPEVRDRGLLDSALARPRHMAAYGKPSLFDLAAAYAHGLVKNHPFLDGNKRVAFLAAATFLERNARRLHATEVDAALQTLALATDKITPADYAAWLSASCQASRG